MPQFTLRFPIWGGLIPGNGNYAVAAKMVIGNNGTSYSTIEELLNSVAGDNDVLRATRLRFQLTCWASLTGGIATQAIHQVFFAWANGTLANAYTTATSVCNLETLEAGLLSTNARKGVTQALAQTPLNRSMLIAEATQGFLHSWRYNFVYNVPPEAAGKLFSDDEGLHDPGYRTFLCHALQTALPGTPFAATDAGGVSGVLTVEGSLKTTNTGQVRLKDLLAEVD